MLDFVNDYSEGAHEKILQRLLETNMEKLSGYGTINIVSQQNRKSGKSRMSRGRYLFFSWWNTDECYSY